MPDGIVAELPTAHALVKAAREARALGYTRLDAFSPYEVPELTDVLRLKRSKLPWAVLTAALFGVILAYAIIRFTNAIDYPLNVGGRPLDSIPADVPICFETAILLGGSTSFFYVLFGSGLPRLWHPVFEVDGFERASTDRFWLQIEESSAADDGRLKDALDACGATRIARTRRAR